MIDEFNASKAANGHGPSTAEADRSSRLNNANAPTPSESFEKATKAFTEVIEFGRHYFAAKAAQTKLTIKRTVIMAGIAVVGLLIVSAALVSATVLLLLGASNAIGTAFSPPKPWIGQVFIGLVFLGGTLLATWLVLRKIMSVSRTSTIAQLEKMRQLEKIKLGHDAAERASGMDKLKVNHG